MAPPNLQGLNIVHPIQPHPVDAHDLLAGQSYPDLSAQLALWTNLAFECDEPITSKHDDFKNSSKNEEEEEEALTSHGSSTGEAAIHDGHINVVTGTNLGSNPLPAHHASSLLQQQPQFDINAFLSSLNVDPFSPPPLHIQPGITPSLAQLIALHNSSAAVAAPNLFPPQQALNVTASSSSSSPSPSSYSDTITPPRHSADDSPTASPVTKRARTRKSSSDNNTSSSVADSPEDDSTASLGVSAAEDKRRRNTAASARFRLKKKEREAALEGKAKELEHRVSELERECEGLRRENGWLKGLVVGVTGVAQQQGPPPVNPSLGTGTKRGRDEE